MSYQFYPNIIFLISVLGVILIILRHLEEAKELQNQAQISHQKVLEKLKNLGLPAKSLSQIKTWGKIISGKIWNFALEAKDLKPSAITGYQIKKIFKARQAHNVPISQLPAFQEAKDEQFYLDQIKLEPKNLRRYDELGRFYLDKENVNDAKDIYLYLVNHEPTNPDFQARLALCYYKQKKYSLASEHYGKSVNLDSTQPARFYNLALSLEMAGDYSKATEFIEKAMALEPDNIKYYISLSSAKNKIGQKDAALKILQDALVKDPQNETVKLKINEFAKK